MKLHKDGYDNALDMIQNKAVSKDEWTPDGADVSPESHLGVEDNGQYSYCFAKSGNCYAQAFKSIAKLAKDEGHDDVADAAQELLDHVDKSEDQPADVPAVDPVETPKSRKLHRTATVVKDKALLATLNKSLTIRKADGAANGFWALASVELPEGDTDGDIIVVNGIESDLDPDNGRYIPLLPSHLMRLPDGKAAEIGRIEKLLKTEIEGVPALAMYFTFALDESGEPLDALVASYYHRYRLHYSNTFSVGMDSLDEPEPLPTGGYKFKRTKLFEVSAVAIPANSGAVGLTRSKEQDDEIVSLLKSIQTQLNGLSTIVDSSFSKAFKPLEDRLDMLESTLVVTKDSEQPTVNKDDQINLLELAKELERVFSKNK